MAGAFQLMSPSTATLGDALSEQVKDDTDEQRKRRMLDAQQGQLLGPAGRCQ
jgi:hypothetical protein